MMKLVGQTILITAISVACTKAEEIDNRAIPEHVVPGSFLVELEAEIVDSQDPASFMKSNLLDFTEKKNCRLEVEKVRWEAGGQVLATELLNTFHLQLSNCEMDQEALLGDSNFGGG